MIKPEEAIERIKEHIAIHQYNEPHAIRIAEALQMGIDALEKQVPKKPNEVPPKDNENLWDQYCPSCKNWIGMWSSRLKRGHRINNINRNICPYCGQAIDWEEE